MVDPAGHPPGEVRFGATVKVEEADGRVETFHIVGDDEADVVVGKISWGSPLARSLSAPRSARPSNGGVRPVTPRWRLLRLNTGILVSDCF